MYMNAYQKYMEELLDEYDSLLLSQLLKAVNNKFSAKLQGVDDYAKQMCRYGDYKMTAYGTQYILLREGGEPDYAMIRSFDIMLSFLPQVVWHRRGRDPISMRFFVSTLEHDREISVIPVQQGKERMITEYKELTKEEYDKLLDAARSKKNERLYLLMQTICSTGIRVSELKFITVAAVSCGVAEIRCKGKFRQVFLPKKLCKILTDYIRERKIKSGAVFISKNGKPLDRSNIWADMKKLCEIAGVSKDKVFPHNLRHLFARTYYSLQKDIVRLADILGHSSVNTTRIYTMEIGDVHRKQIEKLGLLRC